MNKVYFVDKPVDWSSHDVVNRVRRILDMKTVGHTGTLDPFASGLLLICTGEATKIVRFLESERKTYRAVLKLGVKTSTADLTGEILETKDVPNLSKDSIKIVLEGFIGKNKQVPPMYSAIKVKGQKLYDLARKGQEIERKARDIEIYSLELVDYKDEEITFDVSCSAGTYIRTLGEDIASKLMTFGHLTSLRRTSIGDYDVKDAKRLEELTKDDGKDIADVLPFRKVVVNKKEATDVFNGKSLAIDSNDPYILVVNESDVPLAIYYYKEGKYSCLRGFNICKSLD